MSDDLDAARARLSALFVATRARTERLAARLTPEDQQLQSMPDASPTKWHRAHTTWFFETFALAPAGIAVVDARYGFLFNSYYEAVGPRHERPKRGLLSRPTAAEVGDYRRRVDERLVQLLATANAAQLAELMPIVELGINHEEQHQELLLTDILHAFAQNPLLPSYLEQAAHTTATSERKHGAQASSLGFVAFDGGLHEIGAPAEEPFAFDNERPRHKQWIEPFALADRLVTAAELEAFLRADGYRTPSLWLSEGYDFVRTHEIAAPLHYTFVDGVLRAFTLAGPHVLAGDEPVAHVSYYEADAIARFLGARLPSEAEWELAATKAAPSDADLRGNFVDDGVLRPLPADVSANGVRQLFGDVWEWTRSSYEPYPGYVAAAGALGEYNGKFMVNQRVLRGGSCLTPRRHVRASYRNFWPAPTRFQMAGIRLARDIAR
ncbi:MAG TPA: ergothioneine biosynthesis protein EgtB [Polyangia bacterium]|nr:ergothioneine biosynthesis protein EgtB [Polyangia bacterium]